MSTLVAVLTETSELDPPVLELVRTVMSDNGIDSDESTWLSVDGTAQIEVVDPAYLLVLGKVALKSLRSELDIRHGRGRPFLHAGRICFAAYHPAAALRNAAFREAFEADVTRFAQLLEAKWWMSMVPDGCTGCPDDAEWWGQDGLGWCQVCVPRDERVVWQSRLDLVAQSHAWPLQPAVGSADRSGQ